MLWVMLGSSSPVRVYPSEFVCVMGLGVAEDWEGPWVDGGEVY